MHKISYDQNQPYFNGLQTATDVNCSNSRVNLTSNPLENSPQTDVVEISSKPKKKELSKGEKIAIGVAGAGAVVLAGVLIAKGRFGKAKNLAENIEFKEGANLEEAINFGKNNLGIKKYEGFSEEDTELLNYLNKGLTELSNKFKGKAEIARKITGKNLEKAGENAYVEAEMAPNTGELIINLDYWRTLKSDTDDRLKELVNNGWIKESGDFNKHTKIMFNSEDVKYMEDLIKSYKCGKTDYATLDSLSNTINEFNRYVNLGDEEPITVIESILCHPGNKEALEGKSILTDIEKIKKMPKRKQSYMVHKMWKETGIPRFRDNKEYDTVFHEQMHLFDKVKLKKRVNNTYYYNCDYEKYPQELKDWVDNKEYQKIAKQISDYAASGPGEYIAEYGSTVLRGNKVSDEAKALYEKLGGPKLPE